MESEINGQGYPHPDSAFSGRALEAYRAKPKEKGTCRLIFVKVLGPATVHRSNFGKIVQITQKAI